MTTAQIQALKIDDLFTARYFQGLVEFKIIKAGPKVVLAERTDGLFAGQVSKFHREAMQRNPAMYEVVA